MTYCMRCDGCGTLVGPANAREAGWVRIEPSGMGALVGSDQCRDWCLDCIDFATRTLAGRSERDAAWGV